MSYGSPHVPPPRVLVVALYPCIIPSHGGQVRLKGLVDGMFAMGLHVRTLGVYANFQFPADARGPSDLVIVDNDFNDVYFQDPLFGDVFVTHFVMQRPMLANQINDTIASFSPDIIWLEQPFLYPLIERALENSASKGSARPKIILSSQNEEAKLKYQLADMPGGIGVFDVTLFDRAEEIEIHAHNEADLVVCISDEEAAVLKEQNIEAIYLPATTAMEFSKPAPPPKTLAKNKQNQPYIAYAASSYWPNVEGFYDMFGDGLGFLKSHEKLKIAGSVGEAIFKDSRFEARRSINEARGEFLGFLPEADLERLYLDAAAVIVPITTGAGANLKMADALASGRPVISTSKGLEGYRTLVHDAMEQGVYEASTPLEFRQLCRLAVEGRLRAPPASLREKFFPRTIHPRLVEIFAKVASMPPKLSKAGADLLSSTSQT
jgi:glycosyltransferase involved in cell wall biosynthesis